MEHTVEEDTSAEDNGLIACCPECKNRVLLAKGFCPFCHAPIDEKRAFVEMPWRRPLPSQIKDIPLSSRRAASLQAAVLLAAASLQVDTSAPAVWESNYPPVLIILCLFCCGLRFGLTWKKNLLNGQVLGIRRALALSTRAPVLLLRPFTYDPRDVRVNGIDNIWSPFEKDQPLGYEESLVREFSEHGPVVAIGSNSIGKAVPQGAARGWCAAEDWQAMLQDLVKRASLVLVLVGTGIGFSWELEYIRGTMEPHQVLLVIPHWRVSLRSRSTLWASFLRFAAKSWPLLPEAAPSGNLIAFGGNWTPVEIMSTTGSAPGYYRAWKSQMG